MRHAGIVALGMGVALFLSGCLASHEDAPEAGMRDASIPLEEQLAVFDDMMRVECARTIRCASWWDFGDWPCSHASTWRADILAGRAHVEVDAARACTAGIEGLGDCVYRSRERFDPHEALEATCRAALVRDALQCGDTRCPVTDTCLLASDCTRRCVPFVRPAPVRCDPEPCPDGWLCEDGTCSPAPGTLMPCQSGLNASAYCIRYADLGQPCGACGPGAYCARDASVCVNDPPPLERGAACLPDADLPCARGLACEGNVCVPRLYCDDTAQCIDGEYCQDGRCTTEPEGARCIPLSLDLAWLDPCPEGLLCAPDRTCRRPLARGDACELGDPCPLGTLCFEGHCAPIVDEGGACTATDVCRHPSRTRCIDGVCARGFRPGVIGGACVAGACETGHCVGDLCQRYLPDGAACTSTDDCPTCDGSICQPLPIVGRGERCWSLPVRCEEGLICRSSAPYVEPSACCE